MTFRPRPLAVGASLLIALGFGFHQSPPAFASEKAPSGPGIDATSPSGGVADPAPLPKVAATKAAAPASKAAPRAVVRVISIPLQEECPADDNEAMNAVRAFRDPETGELRPPTQEEEAALARAIASQTRIRAQAAREVAVGADGSLTYFLGEDGMEEIVARIGSDGKAVFFCVPRSETPKALTRPLAPKKNEAAREEK